MLCQQDAIYHRCSSINIFLLFHNDKVSTNECYQAEHLHVLASSCLWGWVLQSINLMQHFWLLLVGANMFLSWELTNSVLNFKTVRQEIQCMWQRTEILLVTGSKISCVVYTTTRAIEGMQYEFGIPTDNIWNHRLSEETDTGKDNLLE